ncbi:hypothetical protein [Chishuiella sp.]|uniref:hypothetical protein n=1 Tax=Chishuiella sp. TaxID=1969467 RepID=UPI0028ABF79B|nr:hypothetical protein [Chishuiella sp.]
MDSKEFLEEKIKEGVKRHEEYFSVWKNNYPSGTLQEWKSLNEASVNINTTDNSEILAIGIFLLALDEFNH